ncbi:MAG: Uma2 family endonuclease [Chloroflexota bacterium]|nr:Uma2 family endonuclease [Chloroflexota bacterium]MDE2946610.1 Uma2 family endonuclease [Chloroflexota bacterium]
MSAMLQTKTTVAEYLKFDRQSEFKNEYFDGQIYMMAGVSSRHNLILMSLGSALYARVRGKGCSVYGSDMRVKMEATGSYAYPDLSLVCGTPRYENSRPETLLNPKVIFEILSLSTERRDRGIKLRHYREIESLSDYVLISQSAFHIEHHSRLPDDTWLFTDVLGYDASLTLPTLDSEIKLAEIYEQVELEAGS